MTNPGNQPDNHQIGMNARQSFVLLALLFIAPLLITWLMMTGGRGLIPEGTTNHGVLIQPARLLELPEGIRTVDGELPPDFLQGKWTLVYIGDADCDETCVQNIYKMRQVRLAQNENIRRVQRLYLLTETVVGDALAGTLQHYPGMVVAPLSEPQAAEVGRQFAADITGAGGGERVYVVDPLGYLMMYYAPDAEARGMLKDLKKLLKYSRIG